MKFTRFAAALLIALSFPLSAAAGGWAMTSFDELPGSFEAGNTYELTYTILQHGKTPVDVGPSSVFVTDSAGNITEFAAIRTAEMGRYTVQVTFPESGSFTWEVSQGDFGPHDLGTITVADALAATTSASASRFLIPAAFALVMVLLVIQILELIRKRPRSVRAD